MDQTLDYYNKNAKAFVTDTVDVQFFKIQDKFLKFLPKHSWILDFGCGSGRDSKYFLEHGYHVDAVDGSERLCQIASGYIKKPVRQMLFQELNETEKYDAIWACSSILHLPKKELFHVFQLMVDSLKKNGIIYASFKYGTFEGERDGRYFTDFTEDTFRSFIIEEWRLMIIEEWSSNDVRPGREQEKWLNLILRKK